MLCFYMRTKLALEHETQSLTQKTTIARVV